jgi:hypothetical protein
MASEATTRATLQDQLDESERQLGELRNDLDMTKSVSYMHPCCASSTCQGAGQGPDASCCCCCCRCFSTRCLPAINLKLFRVLPWVLVLAVHHRQLPER